jgi:hypothetical protein
MGTRFIINSSAPVNAPTWPRKNAFLPLALHLDHTAANVEKSLGTVADTPPTSLLITSQATTTPQSYYFGRFTSAPLAAQTFVAQTWHLYMSLGCGNSAAGTAHYPAIYFYRPSTDEIQWVFDGSYNPFGRIVYAGGGAIQTEGRVPVASSFTVQDGDVLVYEFWARGAQTMATAYPQTAYINDAAAYIEPTSTTVAFYTPPAGPVATLSVTEEPDSVSADATLGPLPLVATASMTEGADTAAATATVVWTPRTANATLTEANDSVAATSINPRVGSSTLTEANDAIASTATVISGLVADSAMTEAADTVASTVTVVYPARVATAAITEAKDTVASTASPSYPKIETFTEDFEGGTSKWNVFATGGTVEFTGGTSVQSITSAVDGNQATIISVNHYNFLGSSLFWRFVQPIRTTGDVSSVQNGMGVRTPTGGRTIQWYLDTNGALQAVKQDNFVITTIAAVEPNYYANPLPYAWLRVREAAGMVYWDSAPITASNPPIEADWVNRASAVTSTIAGPWTDTLVNLYAYMGTSLAGVPIQPLKLDGVNTAATVAGASVATLAVTEAADVVSSTAIVETGSSTGTLNVTEARDTIAATAAASFPLLETFTENFDAALDTAKWNAVTAGGTIEFTGGTDVQTILSAVQGNQTALISKPHFNFLGSSLFWKFVQPLRVAGNIPGVETGMGVRTPPGGYTIQWWLDTDGSLKAVKQTNYVQTVFAIVEPNYYTNPLPYTWLRIRESAGTVYFDSAPDTASNPPIETDWVNRTTVATSSIVGPWTDTLVNLYTYMQSAAVGVPTQPLKIDGLNTYANTVLPLIVGTLSVTEAADTAAATVTVQSPVLGTLAVTEAADTVSATTVTVAGASLSVTEAKDTVSATATRIAGATLSVTEANDTVSSTATRTAGGALAVTEAKDTVASTVAVTETISVGNLSVTEANDTSASSAGAPALVGDSNIYESPDTVAATVTTGYTPLNATLAVTEANDSLSSAAKAIAGASLSVTEAKDTLAATSVNPRIGTATITEAGDTVAATARAIAGATALLTEAADTLSASAQVATPATATLDVTEADDILISTVTVAMTPAIGNLNVTEAPDTVLGYTVKPRKRAILIT